MKSEERYDLIAKVTETSDYGNRRVRILSRSETKNFMFFVNMPKEETKFETIKRSFQINAPFTQEETEINYYATEYRDIRLKDIELVLAQMYMSRNIAKKVIRMILNKNWRIIVL